MAESVIERMRRFDLTKEINNLNPSNEQAFSEFVKSGVKFASSNANLEKRFYQGLRELMSCIHLHSNGSFVLYEGGIYQGCWLESTGTINVEILARFCPSVSKDTYELFADFQRDDGLLPFRIMAEGPEYNQLQIVTPLARSVWNYYKLNGNDKEFLKKMYESMASYDRWVAQYRNTRGTGCVEAFCVWDTGHDMSPRFWHVPDSTPNHDAAQYSADYPLLPYLAPDLTANIYCQRKYLGYMAEELGESSFEWELKERSSKESLYASCFDEEDGFFYDVTLAGDFIRVQSDVLLRVLACEAVDSALFQQSLERYLLNTRKFFARYPLTSIALDDPRFDMNNGHNGWAGTTNFLTLIRTPHAFEHYGHYVELTWIMQPAVFALSLFTEFAQGMSPWTGQQGFTSVYTPTILCLMDFLERLCGILTTPEQEIWFTALTINQYEGFNAGNEEFAYSRNVEGQIFEILNSGSGAVVYRNGAEWLRSPRGIRMITDLQGSLKAIVGMTVQAIKGNLEYKGQTIPFEVHGNEVMRFDGTGFCSESRKAVVQPRT